MRLAVPFDTSTNRPDSSRWMTRAWTYQEQLLSKRLLYFTETQVYFQCSCSVFCEDSIGEGNPVSAYIFPGSNSWKMGAPYPSTTACFGSFHLKRTQYEHLEDAINDYTNHVERYAARNMSVKSDVLLAFKGIKAVMRHSMTSETSFESTRVTPSIPKNNQLPNLYKMSPNSLEKEKVPSPSHTGLVPSKQKTLIALINQINSSSPSSSHKEPTI